MKNIIIFATKYTNSQMEPTTQSWALNTYIVFKY